MEWPNVIDIRANALAELLDTSLDLHRSAASRGAMEVEFQLLLQIRDLAKEGHALHEVVQAGGLCGEEERRHGHTDYERQSHKSGGAQQRQWRPESCRPELPPLSLQ